MLDAARGGLSYSRRLTSPPFQFRLILKLCFRLWSYKETPAGPACQTAATHFPILIYYSPPMQRLTEVLSMQLCNHLYIDERYCRLI